MALYVGNTPLPLTGLYTGGTRVRFVYRDLALVWPTWPSAQIESLTYSTPGTYTYMVPDWAARIEIVVLGGGGAGGMGGALITGGGGAAGEWGSTTWNTRVPNLVSSQGGQFDVGTQLTIVVGDGGAPSAAFPSVAANNGQNSSVTYASTSLVGKGGQADVGRYTTHLGYSPGNYAYSGVNYTGGAGHTGQAQTNPPAGNPPGGGGSGSTSGLGGLNGRPGGAGAPGRVWMRVIPHGQP